MAFTFLNTGTVTYGQLNNDIVGRPLFRILMQSFFGKTKNSRSQRQAWLDLCPEAVFCHVMWDILKIRWELNRVSDTGDYLHHMHSIDEKVIFK